MKPQNNIVPNAAQHEGLDATALAGNEARVSDYLKQLNQLTLIRHLGLLLIEAQKHRGTSMAVLEGNDQFESRVLSEQLVIARLVEVINHIDPQESLMPEAMWPGIKDDWQALQHHWRDDTVIANFEFHSHFIDRIVKLIWALAQTADYFSVVPSPPQADDGNTALAYSAQNHHTLVKIAFKLMPEMLENIAKLRGLATHACVRGYCDNQSQSRFSHLLQSLNLNKESLRKASRLLQHEALLAVPSLPSILLHEHKLTKLQTLIDEIAISDRIRVKSLDLFDFATEIIDNYSQIIRDALLAFQARLECALLK